MTNEQDTQQSTAGEDKTATQNEDVLSQEDIDNIEDESLKKKLQTTSAQKEHWRKKAVDPETGKPYQELYNELNSSNTEKKEDKTSKNDSSNDKKAGEFGLLEKSYLRSADIVDKDEVELARTVQKETGMELDELVESDYFKYQLDKHRENKANDEATSDIKGGKGTNEAKNTPEYWLQKGTPPTSNDVPDRETRVKIHRAFMNQEKEGKKFYND